MTALRPHPHEISVDVIYDTVCPWCWIGKRRLEQALALRPDVRARVRWRAFLINPEMPAEGLERRTHLARKFGGAARAQRVYAAITEAGLSARIDFAFDRIQRTPSAVNSHRMVFFAERAGLADAAVEAVFNAFFTEGRDIGDIDVLADTGARIGLDADALGAYLKSGEDAKRVREENARAHGLGVNGVPSYVFNGGLIIAGAQAPQVLARMLDAAGAEAFAAASAAGAAGVAGGVE